MAAKCGQIYFYDWDQEIKEFKASGMKMYDFCQTKDYPYTAFSYHYYRKRKKALEAEEENSPVVFAQVVPAGASNEVISSINISDSNICINGLNITVTERTSMTALKKVLKALEEL